MPRIKQRNPVRKPSFSVYSFYDPRIPAAVVSTFERSVLPYTREALTNVEKYLICNRAAEGKNGIGKFCFARVEKEGELLAIYQGEVLRDKRRLPDNSRIFEPPGSGVVVLGSEPSRFNAADFNHSCTQSNCYYVDLPTDGLPCIGIVSKGPIEAGSELLVDYGDAYFMARPGTVPCQCARPAVCPKGRMF